MGKTRSQDAETQLLPATASRKGLGGLPLGSLQSRAAARSLIAARQKSEQDGLRFQTVSVLDGKRADLTGLADKINEARRKNHEAWKLSVGL
jgi:hypothetical protein